MRIAFKEWAVVDEALARGAQTILLRKGGIQERQGRFEVRHRRFLVYPTWLHQKAESLKPAWHDVCRRVRSDEARVAIRHLVEVAEILEAPPDPAMADRWDALHIYDRSLVADRYAYKPDLPLYLLLVRVYRLAEPVWIEETPRYAGCRSWVELDEDIPTEAAVPILDDAAFRATARAVRAALRPDA